MSTFFNRIFPKNLLGFSSLEYKVFKVVFGLFLVTGVAAVGNRYYIDWKYPLDEYGTPIDCKCGHCNRDKD